MPSISDSVKAANWPVLLPLLSLLLAATLWGIFWYPLRELEDHGLQGLWAAFFIYCGTLPWLLWLSRGRWAELRLAPWPLLCIALCSGWTNTAFILAMLDGQVMRVLLLFFLSPLWATLIGWLALREQVHSLALLVLGIALSGAVIMLWHPDFGYPWPHDRADWLALSAGMSFAVMNALVRYAAGVSIQLKTSVNWLGAMLVSLLLILLTGAGMPQAAAPVIGAALLFGALVMVVMTLSVVYGVTHMPVHRSSVILLFELVAGAVSSQLLTAEVISPNEWIGGILIVAAAWLSARNQLRHPAG